MTAGSGLVHDNARVLAALVAAVVDTTSDGVIGQDPDGLITVWNTSAERIFGVSRGAVIGTSFARFLDPGAAGRWQELLMRVQTGKRIDLPSLTLHREGGLVVNASVHLTALTDSRGEFIGSSLVVHDQTEELIAQQTLAAGEEQVRRSEALASAGSFVIDGADSSEQWSEGMHRIYRVSPQDFDGTRAAHLDLVHPDDRAAVASVMTKALDHGSSAEQDHRLSTDTAVWVFLAVEPVVDQFGRTTGISGVCQDVTARKEVEAAAREALAVEQKVNEGLRQLDALKDDFLATVSHELRTPLTSIGGYASLLAKKHPDQVDLIGPIERNAAEMSRMIETLLDFCRLTAGQVVMSPQPVTLAQLVDDCTPRSTTVAMPEFRNEVAPEFTLITDPDALCRIVNNLLGNAARYAGSTSTVSVRASTDASGATLICVADNGPGIASEHLPRLFERFYQVPGEAARRGTGIGLAIVHEYVAKLGGTVWCDSVEGAGATFSVRLP